VWWPGWSWAQRLPTAANKLLDYVDFSDPDQYDDTRKCVANMKRRKIDNLANKMDYNVFDYQGEPRVHMNHIAPSAAALGAM
jgi:hypothetical protein